MEQPIHQISTYMSPFSASPILSIAVLSILATLLFLFFYYIFITKFSSFHSHRHEDSFTPLSPTTWNRGLDESTIHRIPAFIFSRDNESSGIACVVCLSEFREREMLRILPKCSHTFHLLCIDMWLQTNSNCPLCRTSISGNTKLTIDQIVAPTSSPQNSHTLIDEDFVVIELGGEDQVVSSSAGLQESTFSREVPVRCFPKNPGNKVGESMARKCRHVSIMGDEGIDVRAKDDRFFIQPIRRSFSMDSAADQQLYLTVQMIIHQGRQITESSSSNCVENDTRNPTSFFPFRPGRGFKRTILPVESVT